MTIVGTSKGLVLREALKHCNFGDLAGTLQKEQVLYDVSLIQLAKHRKGAKPCERICDELDCIPAGAFQQHNNIYFDVPFSQKFHAALPNRSLEKSRKISTSLFSYIYISSFLYVNVQVRWDDHSIVPLDSSIHHT